jgi:hypothetical protein
MKKMTIVASAIVLASLATSVKAAETASGTIASAPIAGGFQYTIKLTDTSTTSIGTFWFSWIPPIYDFMNVAPTNVTVPTGWIDSIVHDTGEGYSIEAYNTGGPADQLAPGATDTFSFDSTETLSQISGPGAGPLGSFYSQTTSYVYAGMPETDSGFLFNVTPVVPEPASASIFAIGAGVLTLRRRRV